MGKELDDQSGVDAVVAQRESLSRADDVTRPGLLPVYTGKGQLGGVEVDAQHSSSRLVLDHATAESALAAADVGHDVLGVDLQPGE